MDNSIKIICKGEKRIKTVKENPNLQFTVSEKAKQFAKIISANCHMKNNLDLLYKSVKFIEGEKNESKENCKSSNRNMPYGYDINITEFFEC